MKKCKKCGIEKEEELFPKVDEWYRSICRVCNNLKKKEWYEKNRDRCRHRVSQKYHCNKDPRIEERKKFRQENRDLIQEMKKEKKKEWTRRNRDRIKKSIEKHKDKIRKRMKAYKNKRKKQDPLYALRQSISSTIRSALYHYGFSKDSSTATLIGCSYEDLMLHLGSRPLFPHHLDHVCPCSQAQNEEELIKLQHYSNLRWLKAEDNLSKSDSWTPEGEELCRTLLGRDWIHEV